MPFVKGQSGNPGGRPKKTAAMIEIEELAKQHGPAAIKRLAYWMNQTAEPAASVKAAITLLERGFGKPLDRRETTVTTERMVVVAPPVAKDADEWAKWHAPPAH